MSMRQENKTWLKTKTKTIQWLIGGREKKEDDV